MQYFGIILLLFLLGLVFLAAWVAGRISFRETPRAAEEDAPPSPEPPQTRDDLPAAAILAAVHLYRTAHGTERK